MKFLVVISVLLLMLYPCALAEFHGLTGLPIIAVIVVCTQIIVAKQNEILKALEESKKPPKEEQTEEKE